MVEAGPVRFAEVSALGLVLALPSGVPLCQLTAVVPRSASPGYSSRSPRRPAQNPEVEPEANLLTGQQIPEVR